MKRFKNRHIIGTLAIIAIVVMNLIYAHNNYGIPQIKDATKVCATTQQLGYRHTNIPVMLLCTQVEYRVIVHYYTHKNSRKDSCYVTVTERFLDFNQEKAHNEAMLFSLSIQAPDYAELDKNYSLIHAPYDTFRKECKKDGQLKECDTEDASCETYFVKAS